MPLVTLTSIAAWSKARAVALRLVLPLKVRAETQSAAVSPSVPMAE